MSRGAEPVLEHGRTREGVVARLLELVQEEPATIIGLDSCFSFPSWFFAHLGTADVHAMWSLVAGHGEEWLATCPWPFWGRAQRLKPTTDAVLYRKTEQHDGAKSVFQLYYAGAVGTSSLRGMPHLLTLRDGGAHVWPFQRFALPAVIEIYPRRFTGPVAKSSETARRTYLVSRYGPAAAASEPVASEDAFDAYVSVREMHARIQSGAGFPEVSEAQLLLEGLIWDGLGASA